MFNWRRCLSRLETANTILCETELLWKWWTNLCAVLLRKIDKAFLSLIRNYFIPVPTAGEPCWTEKGARGCLGLIRQRIFVEKPCERAPNSPTFFLCGINAICSLVNKSTRNVCKSSKSVMCRSANMYSDSPVQSFMLLQWPMDFL